MDVCSIYGRHPTPLVGCDEVISLSLLKKRAIALVYGFAAGEALGFPEPQDIGEMTASAWELAKVVALHGSVDEVFLRNAVFEERIALPDASAAEDAIVGARSVLAAGFVRRPQDYNGLVDDVTSIVAIQRYTSRAVAGGCSVAAFIAALLDGWDMESAGNLAVAIAKRGSTFGRKDGGMSVSDEIRDALMRVDEYIIRRTPDVDRALEAIMPTPPLARAIGIAYACRNAKRAVEAASALCDHARFTGAIAGALCAAHRPETLPTAWVKQAKTAARPRGYDPEQIAEELLDLRWKRSPVIW